MVAEILSTLAAWWKSAGPNQHRNDVDTDLAKVTHVWTRLKLTPFFEGLFFKQIKRIPQLVPESEAHLKLCAKILESVRRRYLTTNPELVNEKSTEHFTINLGEVQQSVSCGKNCSLSVGNSLYNRLHSMLSV